MAMSDARLREIEARRVAFRNWEAFCAEGYELLDKDVPELMAALREVQGELALANETIGLLRAEVETQTAYAQKSQERYERDICPGCGRTIGRVFGDHTMKGGMPLCSHAHVDVHLLEEAQERADSEYRRGVEAAAKIAEEWGAFYSSETRKIAAGQIWEGIRALLSPTAPKEEDA